MITTKQPDAYTKMHIKRSTLEQIKRLAAKEGRSVANMIEWLIAQEMAANQSRHE
jgi:CopG-like RHH_1 or ribbon-helix-helix domain, RHH_5